MANADTLRLTLKLDGPLVEEHRLPLSELLRVGKQLRDSLRDVAIVLTQHGPSGTAGRSKKVIEDSVDLRVVAAPRAGSFALDLEAPPQGAPDQGELSQDLRTGLSERAVEAFVEGLESLSDESDALPHGFDRGVLRSIVPFRIALRKGLTEIDLDATARGARYQAQITAAKVDIVERLIQRPVTAAAAAEGVLQMVDFGTLEFRIDRPPLPSVGVYFAEQHRDAVHDAVRQFVRVHGVGEFQPERHEPSRIWASTIEVLYETLELDIGAFWREGAVRDLAEEQGAVEYALPGDLDSDPWRDDREAAALIEAIHGRD
ncbi:MAG: hypothetical protein WKF33_01020 [Thermoleophilaceae bacterium]